MGVRIVSIRDETIGVHGLERCEACGRYHTSQKFIKHKEMQTTKHTAVKEHHLYTAPPVQNSFQAEYDLRGKGGVKAKWVAG